MTIWPSFQTEGHDDDDILDELLSGVERPEDLL